MLKWQRETIRIAVAVDGTENRYTTLLHESLGGPAIDHIAYDRGNRHKQTTMLITTKYAHNSIPCWPLFSLPPAKKVHTTNNQTQSGTHSVILNLA